MDDATQSKSADNPPRYVRCPDTIKFAVGEDSLTYSGVTKAVSILTPLQASLLNLCDAPRTLAEHAQFCRAQIANLSGEEINQQLHALVENKSLLSATFMQDYFAHADADDYKPGAISHVGIVTCARPLQLQRCLAGYAANARQHGKCCEFVVVDDTRDAAARAQTRSMLRAEAAAAGLTVTYLGQEEKVRLAELLSRAGNIPREVLQFGLFGRAGLGVTIGANRNALHLYTTGRQFLSTDDDVFCQIAAAPQSSAVPVVGNLDRYTQFWFFPDRQATLAAVQETDLDLLTTHEEFLGANVASYLAAREGEYEFHLREIDPPFLRSLVASKAKVHITYMGTMGDSAFRSTAFYFALEGPSRTRFLATEEQYRSACHNREVLRAVTRPVITKNSRCMTGAYACDNRAILPPYFPVERNEDGIFGMTLRATVRDSCFAHLPYALLHDPPEQRSYATGELWRSDTFRHISALVIASINSFGFARFPSTSDNIVKLGHHLTAIGKLLPPDFEDFIRVHLFRELAAGVSALEKHLRLHQRTPAYWAADVERYLDGLRQTLLSQENIYPLHYSAGRSHEEVLLISRQLIYDFGQLLCWWPVLTETAAATDMTQVLR